MRNWLRCRLGFHHLRIVFRTVVDGTGRPYEEGGWHCTRCNYRTQPRLGVVLREGTGNGPTVVQARHS